MEGIEDSIQAASISMHAGGYCRNAHLLFRCPMTIVYNREVKLHDLLCHLPRKARATQFDVSCNIQSR